MQRCTPYFKGITTELQLIVAVWDPGLSDLPVKKKKKKPKIPDFYIKSLDF